jgi:hypothetical protein
MRISLVSVSAAVFAITSMAAAQGGSIHPACQDPAFVGPGLEGGDPCQRAVDVFAYATEQYSVLLVGGNPEVGRADALGKFLSFRVSLQGNIQTFYVPAFKELGSGLPTGPAQQGTISLQTTDYGTLSAGGVVGIFGGFDLGVIKIGALDAILNLNVVPALSAGGYKVTGGQKFYFGWGGRLGVIQEGKLMPAVGIGYLKRDLPQTNIIASDVLDNTIAVTDMKINSEAWTVTVGKHLGIFGLVLGTGQTKFNSTGQLAWSVNGINPTTIPTISGSSTQTEYFGDVDFALGSSVNLALEYGQVSKSDLKTYNSFDPPSSSTKSFFAVLLSIGH